MKLSSAHLTTIFTLLVAVSAFPVPISNDAKTGVAGRSAEREILAVRNVRNDPNSYFSTDLSWSIVLRSKPVALLRLPPLISPAEMSSLMCVGHSLKRISRLAEFSM